MVKFTGRVEAISTGAWRIDGQIVKTDGNTRVDERNQRATPGVTAQVVALRLQDGSLLALEIVVELSPAAPEQPFEFQGVIEQLGQAQWIVAGHALSVSAQTTLEGNPQVGWLAQVKSMRRSDGSLRAVRIVVLPPGDEVQFEGVIESASAQALVVDGTTVRIDAQTVVVGVLTPGHRIEVQGWLLPDGVVLGRRLVVQAPPSPTATMQSAQPTPTSLAATSRQRDLG